MIINMRHDGTTGQDRQRILVNMIKQFADHYNIGQVNQGKLMSDVLGDAFAQRRFTQYMLDHHQVTLTPWQLGDYGRGYDIQEDPHFTLYQLKDSK